MELRVNLGFRPDLIPTPNIPFSSLSPDLALHEQ